MYKKLSLAVAISAAFGLQGCHLSEGDDSTSTTESTSRTGGFVENQDQATGDIQGFVFSGSDKNEAIKDAKISVGGQTVKTNEQGAFVLKNVGVSGLVKGERDLYTGTLTVDIDAGEKYVGATVDVPVMVHIHDSVDSTTDKGGNVSVTNPNTVVFKPFTANISKVMLPERGLKLKTFVRQKGRNESLGVGAGQELTLTANTKVYNGQQEEVLTSFHNTSKSEVQTTVEYKTVSIKATADDHGKVVFKNVPEGMEFSISSPWNPVALDLSGSGLKPVQHGNVALRNTLTTEGQSAYLHSKTEIDAGNVIIDTTVQLDQEAPFVSSVYGAKEIDGANVVGGPNTAVGRLSSKDVTQLEITFSELLEDNKLDLKRHVVLTHESGHRIAIKSAKIESRFDDYASVRYSVLKVELKDSLRKQLAAVKGLSIKNSDAVDFNVYLKGNAFLDRQHTPFLEGNELTNTPSSKETKDPVSYDSIVDGTNFEGTAANTENNRYVKLALRTVGDLPTVSGTFKAEQVFVGGNVYAYDETGFSDLENRYGLQHLNIETDTGRIEDLLGQLQTLQHEVPGTNDVAVSRSTARIKFTPVAGVVQYKVSVKRVGSKLTFGSHGFDIRLPENAKSLVKSSSVATLSARSNEFMLDNVRVGDVVVITPVVPELYNGKKVNSAYVTLVDKVTPFPVVQYAYGLNTLGGGQAGLNSAGHGGENVIDGVDAKSGHVILPITPRLLGESKVHSYATANGKAEREKQYSLHTLFADSTDLVKEERFASLSVQALDHDSDATTDLVPHTKINQLGVYSAEGFKKWNTEQSGPSNIGIAFSEDVELVSNAQPSLSAAGEHVLDWGVRNNRHFDDNETDGVSGKEEGIARDLVVMKTAKVVDFATNANGAVINFGKSVQDKVTNVASEGANVVVKDKMPPLVTEAYYDEYGFTVKFNEAVKLTRKSHLVLNTDSRGENTATVSTTIDLSSSNVYLSEDGRTLHIKPSTEARSFDVSSISNLFTDELNIDNVSTDKVRMDFGSIEDLRGNNWDDFHKAVVNLSDLDKPQAAVWFTKPLFAAENRLGELDVNLSEPALDDSNTALTFVMYADHQLDLTDATYRPSFLNARGGVVAIDVSECANEFAVSSIGGGAVAPTLKDCKVTLENEHHNLLPRYRVTIDFDAPLSAGEYSVKGVRELKSAWLGDTAQGNTQKAQVTYFTAE